MEKTRAPGRKRERGPVDVVARLPKLVALLGPRRPDERAALIVGGDFVEPPGLFGDAVRGAVELDEQHRRLRQIELRIGVAGLDLQRIQQLDPRDGNSRLDGLNGRQARGANARKRTMPARDRLGNAGEAQRDLGDDAERSLGADEQTRQIISGRGFAGAARGAREFAAGGDDAERDHVVSHRPVAHRVGSRGARRSHAADRSVGAGIDREEEAAVAQVRIERLARYAGLDDAIEILGVDRENPVHAAAVQRESAVERVDVAFERCADAERHNRRIMRRANAHGVDHVLAALGEHDSVRRRVRQPGQRMAMLHPHGLGRHELVAEPGGERSRERRDDFRRQFSLALAKRGVLSGDH